jgi:hypothetical protein
MYDCGNPHCISMSVHMLVCVLMMYNLIDCLTVFHYGKQNYSKNYTVILCLTVKCYNYTYYS